MEPKALPFTLRVSANGGLGLLDGLHGTGAGHAAAGTGHALQQIAGVLACHRLLHHLAALPQALGAGHLDLPAGVAVLDNVDHCLGHAAAHGEAAPVGRGIVDAVRVLLDGGQIHMLGRKDPRHLLKLQHDCVPALEEPVLPSEIHRGASETPVQFSEIIRLFPTPVQKLPGHVRVLQRTFFLECAEQII